MAQQAKRQQRTNPPDNKLAYKRLHEVLKAATHLLGYFASPQADTLTLRHLNNVCTSFQPPRSPCVIVPPLITEAAVSLISLRMGDSFGLTANKFSPLKAKVSLICDARKQRGRFFLSFYLTVAQIHKHRAYVCEGKVYVWKTVHLRCTYIDIMWYRHSFQVVSQTEMRLSI